jgi:hypothetical protein
LAFWIAVTSALLLHGTAVGAAAADAWAAAGAASTAAAATIVPAASKRGMTGVRGQPPRRTR